MRLEVPITGTVLEEGSGHGAGLVGDDKDPVRLINIDLGNVSWQFVDIDLDREVMIIDVQPGRNVTEPVLDAQGVQKMANVVARDSADIEMRDAEGKPIYELQPVYKVRSPTVQEKARFLQHARSLIEGHSKDELYTMSKCSRLKRPV